MEYKFDEQKFSEDNILKCGYSEKYIIQLLGAENNRPTSMPAD